MNRMFGTVSGQIRATRRGFGVLGTLVSLGICACGAPESRGFVETTSSATGLPPAPAPTGTPPAMVPGATQPAPMNPPPVIPGTPNPPPNPGNPPAPSTSVTAPPPPPGTGNPTPVPTSSNPPTPNPTSEPPAPVNPPPVGNCSIVPSAEISSAIATVGIVTFTSDVEVTSAKIEFTNMAGGDTFTAPVDLEAEGYRTLLLGMKPGATYTYKVIVNDTCSSPEGSLTTGNLPAGGQPRLPRITQSGPGPAMKGFYVVSVYAGGTASVILDQDGDIVWYGGGVSGQDGTSRSRMDWEGKYMWSIAANPFPGDGAIRRVSMDGLEDTTNVPGTEYRHHDLTAVPGGVMTFIAHQPPGGQGRCSRIVELGPDGNAKDIVGNINEIYKQVNDCHPNSISYQVEDDTYIVGDREASMFVKITRDGEVVWQVGGANPVGASFQGAGTWNISHGHHYFQKGNEMHILVFNNGSGLSGSNILEFTLDETAMTANKIWTLGVDGTAVMGDVQRLPNDNTLVALTTRSIIREVGPGDSMVNEFNIGTQVGYVDYRPTLYGVPAKANLDYKNFE